MVNSYDIAILSEKVARLEALLAGGGVALPEVTSEDNGATLQVVEGVWAKGDEIPAIINALNSTSETAGLSAAQGKALNEKFKIEQKNFDAFTVSASTYYDVDIPVTESGYTPVGVIQWTISGAGAISTIYVNIVDNTTAKIRVRNNSDAPVTTTGGNITVLYEKTV